jgi:ABC-type branched-subunit amino acid transport system substrate-binding protein
VKRLPAALFLAALALWPHHGEGKPAPKPPALVLEAEEIGATNRMAGIAKLEEYLAGKTDADVRPWAMVWAGEQRRLANDRTVARAWFERAAAEYPSHPVKAGALVGMVLVDAEKGLSGNAIATLSMADDKSLPDTMNADRYRVLTRDAVTSGMSGPKVRDLARKALAFAADDPDVLARVSADIGPLASDEKGKPRELPTEVPMANAEDTALARLRADLAADKYEAVKESGRTFLASWPDSPYAKEVGYLIRRADAKDPAVAGRVGVLLPQAGKYTQVSERIREMVDFANRSLGGKLELVYFNTGDETGDPVKGIEELVLQKGCVALLGPMLKEHIKPAAEAAQGLGVPLVTLNQTQDPQSAGDFTFRAFLPVDQQVEALLDHAMKTRGLSSFAILHPRNPYGEGARDAFAAAVERRGGKVGRVVSYDPNAKSFLGAARELASRDYKAGAAELARLRSQAKAKGMDPAKVVLPPSVEFQAIFIPDAWQRASLVASALAYEEFPVGKFRPQWGMEPLLLLGLNGWNNPEIGKAGGDYMQGAVFVDAFLPTSTSPDIESFVDAYKSAFNRRPDVIDATTYDAVRLLNAAVIAGGTDRDAIRKELSEAKIDRPVAGGDHFGADRDVERTLLVLTIDGNSIRPWATPEELAAP